MTATTTPAAVLLDIEGTTTPVAFVYEVLFPYAEARLEETCRQAGDDPEIAAAVELLRTEHADERDLARDRGAEPPPFGNGAAYARKLMAEDRKSTGLKALQGLIWRRGYADGSLRATVFPDVPPALEAWRAAGVRLRVYSSGSVLAQQLLFRHTDHGDLTAFFEGYHDTTTGPKREATSYRAIAEAMALPPGDILFLSDVTAELDAAAEAGMRTALIVRPGNAPTEPGPHPRYRSFLELTRATFTPSP